MEHRVGALEKSVGRIEDKLDKVLNELKEFRIDSMVKFARIEERLEHKASSGEVAEAIGRISIELAEIKGRVNVLPTIFQMITLVLGILGGAFLILKFGLPHGP